MGKPLDSVSGELHSDPVCADAVSDVEQVTWLCCLGYPHCPITVCQLCHSLLLSTLVSCGYHNI